MGLIDLPVVPVTATLLPKRWYSFGFRWEGGKPAESVVRQALFDAGIASVAFNPDIIDSDAGDAGFFRTKRSGVTMGHVYSAMIAIGATHGVVWYLPDRFTPPILFTIIESTQEHVDDVEEAIDTGFDIAGWLADYWWVPVGVIGVGLAVYFVKMRG